MKTAPKTISALAAAVLALGAGLLVSPSGIDAVAKREALRLTAYPDPGTRGAPYTICYGHTGREVYLGLTVTQYQCEKWLAEDLLVAQKIVLKNVKVPLRQGQLDAYVSFVFNVGPVNFKNSTMLRLLNQGDYVGSCNQFPNWVYANKIKLEGLAVRRSEERLQCLQGGPYVYFPK